MSQNTLFPSRVDLWLAALLYLAPVAVVLLGIPLHKVNPGAALVVFMIATIILFLTVLMTVPCHYTLTNTQLLIRCGVITEDIDLENIQAIEPIVSLLAAPALSIQRLKLHLADGGAQYISPRDPEAFMTAFKRRREALPGISEETSPRAATD